MNLGGLDPSVDTSVWGINDNNIVVGQSYNAENADFEVAMAWKWNGSTGGQMVSLTSALGGNSPNGFPPGRSTTKTKSPESPRPTPQAPVIRRPMSPT